ncbi:DNA replication ATP-dependent helicase/nuclease DNA2-like isoform X2 [Limulus polyphemus]|uniref:DNA replication ATP-dependent helicase/nuclease n=1 Tax=Limulus polyphemus TaxID=6850 RepID=A0ABM1T6I9_LIMPO|nr:DNA replication ATP-dependent helicase/nuclease DNA2-like isoform X2 [Limulus polyphemus]XP_022251496.1 DNA replication ATP-dependent helicase/nuclease DNA2-like isoform X2 [Limulus polyphemus]
MARAASKLSKSKNSTNKGQTRISSFFVTAAQKKTSLFTTVGDKDVHNIKLTENKTKNPLHEKIIPNNFPHLSTCEKTETPLDPDILFFQNHDDVSERELSFSERSNKDSLKKISLSESLNQNISDVEEKTCISNENNKCLSYKESLTPSVISDSPNNGDFNLSNSEDEDASIIPETPQEIKGKLVRIKNTGTSSDSNLVKRHILRTRIGRKQLFSVGSCKQNCVSDDVTFEKLKANNGNKITVKRPLEVEVPTVVKKYCGEFVAPKENAISVLKTIKSSENNASNQTIQPILYNKTYQNCSPHIKFLISQDDEHKFFQTNSVKEKNCFDADKKIKEKAFNQILSHSVQESFDETVFTSISDRFPTANDMSSKQLFYKDSKLQKTDEETTPSKQFPANVSKSIPMKQIEENAVELAFCEDSNDALLQSALENLSPFKIPCSSDCSRTVVKSNLKLDEKLLTKDFRYRVASVQKSADQGVLLRLNPEDDSSSLKTCSLQGFWTDTLVSEGDNVHVIASFVNGHCVINDEYGLLVVNPDHLVSSTSVVSSLFCMRKAVLMEKFRGWEKGNLSMLQGSLIHELFQEVVQHKIVSQDEMKRRLKVLLNQQSSLHEMYGLGITETELETEMMSYLPHIHEWIQHYMLSGPSQLKADNCNENTDLIKIEAVQDIEDNIWCPKFGIKGKIDLTVDVTIHSRGKSQKKTVPLELKTGKPTFSMEHQGQVTLYTMMMSDRSTDPEEGLLLYLQGGPQMKRFSTEHRNVRGLIQLRNELSHYTGKVLDMGQNMAPRSAHLPEPISNKRACTKCPHLLSCSLYQRAIEDYTPSSENHPMSILVPETLNHLSSDHLAYFKNWILLLNLELSATHQKYGTSFWNEDSLLREKKGICLSGMTLRSSVKHSKQLDSGQWVMTFQKNSSASFDNLKNIGLNPCDFVLISKDGICQEVAIAMGTVLSVLNNSVEVVTDKDLTMRQGWEHMVFRIDLNVSFSVIAVNFVNLARLMSPDPQAEKIRSFVIDRKQPKYLNRLDKQVVLNGREIMKCLNKPQQRAVLKTLMCKDYIMWRGMPGTGKTLAIVSLVRILVKFGYSVLLTSYTHSAVDNILLKLLNHNVDFIRLGHLGRIHPQIQPFCSEKLTKDVNSVEELTNFYLSKPVVATTCLGINHVLFRKRKFDFCIIDEASQILQVASLGPLLHCHRFVLVGDPQQLPPVVQSKQARDLGMAESLFSRLSTPDNTIDLNIQYRMNSEIMSLSNLLTYNGALECGSEETANATLTLFNTSFVRHFPSLDSWPMIALAAELKYSVVVLNTDLVPAKEACNLQGLVSNPVEVELVTQLALLLLKGGLEQKNIGVITPYRRQVHLLREALGAHNVCELEVNTVDQYQGRDKEAVIFSCVRSNQENSSGEILHDARRLNVAITRAKHKLIIIGSKMTLLFYEPFRQLLSALKECQLLDLPPEAHLTYKDIVHSL